MSKRPITYRRDRTLCPGTTKAHRWVKSFFDSYCRFCGKPRSVNIQ